MATAYNDTPIHWNYFLSLEDDVLTLSRYVEFCASNDSTYSIEQVRILLAASSEVDVLAKLLCKEIEPRAQPGNINEYRNIIVPGLEHFNFARIHDIRVNIPRFGLSFLPWAAWCQSDLERNVRPPWWDAYNKVKHERNLNFEKANLLNTLNSVAALFVLLSIYYRILTDRRIFPLNAQLFGPPKLFQSGSLFYGLTHG